MWIINVYNLYRQAQTSSRRGERAAGQSPVPPGARRSGSVSSARVFAALRQDRRRTLARSRQVCDVDGRLEENDAPRSGVTSRRRRRVEQCAGHGPYAARRWLSRLPRARRRRSSRACHARRACRSHALINRTTSACALRRATGSNSLALRKLGAAGVQHPVSGRQSRAVAGGPRAFDDLIPARSRRGSRRTIA